MLRLLLIFLIVQLTACSAGAQFYTGIAAGIGSGVKSNVDHRGLLLTPHITYASLTFLMQYKLHNQYYLHYSVGAEALRYQIGFLPGFDTVSYSGFINTFPDIEFNINGSMSVGRRVNVADKHIIASIGGGLSYFTDYSIGTKIGRPYVFEYRMERSGDEPKFFFETSVQTRLNRRVLFSIRYRHQFSSALKGTYNFYHVNDPPAGKLSLTPRNFSALLLIRINKENNKEE